MNQILIYKQKYQKLFPELTERSRRLIAAADAEILGWGGISIIQQASGLSDRTIKNGIKELKSKTSLPANRCRKQGGGRKKLTAKDKTVVKDLKKLVANSTRGDPESLLLYTLKSTYKLAEDLVKKHHKISYKTVGTLLKKDGYSLQANKKTKESTANHPDRDKQFKYINRLAKMFIKANEPVISVDTKKKELVGNYENKGKDWRPKGKPIEVNGHDFPDKRKGKAVPYGIYDISDNKGYINIGINHDTSEFAVASIKRWWNNLGKDKYAQARRIMITADCGGSNGYRTKLWKKELQKFADETKKDITVCHFPPGTSKWNKIEHRLFSFISTNWKGRPLTSYKVIINLIAATTTKTGLKVYAELDKNKYELKKRVTDKEMEQLKIERHKFHGEWNYTIKFNNKFR